MPLSMPKDMRPTAAMAAAAILFISLCSLAGWLFDLPALTSLLSNGPRMFPMTAVGVMAVSFMLFLQALAPRKARGMVRLLAAGVTSLGGLSLLMRIIGWSPAPLSLATGTDSPVWSLPALVTSGLFVGTGVSLGTMTSRRTVGLAQVLSVGVFLFSLLTFTAFVFRDTSLYQLIPGRGTSLPTTLSCLLASYRAQIHRPK